MSLKKPRPYDHKQVLREHGNECHSCGVKNYSLVSFGTSKSWEVHPDFIKGSSSYDTSRDAANFINKEATKSHWEVIVLTVHKWEEGYVPFCSRCAGRPFKMERVSAMQQKEMKTPTLF